jgi:hypothetical protein
MARGNEKAVPSWVDEFVEEAGDSIDSGDVPLAYMIWAPLGSDEDSLTDPWVVHYYPSVCEVVGGAHDGKAGHTGLDLDVVTLQECFEEVDELRWMSGVYFNEEYGVGNHLQVSGHYDGHAVLLRIFDKPPRDEPVMSVIDHRRLMLRPVQEGHN